MFKALAICSLLLALQVAVTQQQHQQQYTTPVPILKQIDRQNDDGSYTYGYEAADKSFKIETKYANGEVYGKYGYVDDQGTVREIEYGASKRGFEPAGSDINVPPPTLTNSQSQTALGPNEVDDGQYREDPSVYYKNENFQRPVAASKFSLNNFQQQPQQSYYNPTPQQYYNNNNQQPFVTAPAPAPTPAPLTRYQQPVYQQPAYQQPAYQQPAYQQPAYQQPAHQQPAYQQPAFQQQPHYQPQYYQQPQQQQHNYNSIPNHFHPAVKNLDISSGSYSIDYTGRK